MQGFLLLLIYAAAIGGWIQHIITCVEKDLIFLLFVGMFIVPAGVAHGWLVWLGVA